MENNYLLQVKNVSKTFKISKKQQKLNFQNENFIIAVNNVSFNLIRGEIYGLLGPNGAGKTTTLRMIATLIHPDKGDIVLDDISYKDDIAKIRNRIGFLTSELKLEDYFTPNYLFDFFAELHHIDKVEAAKRKESLFRKFGIDKFQEVKVANLSTGMKQKLSIVISILHDPELIIFDEPTNGLDVITAKVVTDYLLELKSMGKTIIISTHIFELAEKLSDRIGIIIKGKLVEEGTIKELTKDKSLEDHFFDLYSKEVGDNE
jgi:sodium transport system ATP-binding protein